MNRNDLIALAIKCNGEYTQIVKAINSDNKPDILDIDISGINAITIFDKEYPKQLFQLAYPPFVLFYKGNINLLKENMVSIVGTRMPCEYSLKATKTLVEKLNKERNVVVSGLAKGIDACAHQNAERTIGVIGCGINYIYPSSNYDLYKKIAKEGLIISEYPNLCKPLAYHFPFRNRIIAALGETSYIMECSEKSGTMTELNEALNLSKQVKVLPFDVFSKAYNNTLINEGAMIITL